MSTKVDEVPRMVLAVQFPMMFDEKFLELLAVQLHSVIRRKMLADNPRGARLLELLWSIQDNRVAMCREPEMSAVRTLDIVDAVIESTKEVEWGDLLEVAWEGM